MLRFIYQNLIIIYFFFDKFYFYNNIKNLCYINNSYENILNYNDVFTKNYKNLCFIYENLNKTKINEIKENKKDEWKNKVTKRIDKPYKEIYFSDIKCQIFPKICKEYKKKVIKFALIVIIKNENLYIKEFIQYYFSIGVDKIIICDNNDIDGERIEDILYNFINNGFVEIVNYRGKKKYQVLSYQEVYLKYMNFYDWFMFFDADEYLIIPKYKNINHLFNKINYDNFDIIHVNWIYYDDNELIYYDNRSLQMRFKRPRYLYNNKNENNKMNIHIKSIIRTGFLNFEWRGNPHTPSGPIPNPQFCLY